MPLKKGKKTVSYEVEDVGIKQVMVRLKPKPVVAVQIRTQRSGDLPGPQSSTEGTRFARLADAKLAADIIALVEAALDAS